MNDIKKHIWNQRNLLKWRVKQSYCLKCHFNLKFQTMIMKERKKQIDGWVDGNTNDLKEQKG